MSKFKDNAITEDIDNKYIVKPVSKSLQVLTMICESNTHLSLTDICSSLEIPKSTVLRYLVTLESSGFISQDKNGHYYPSLKLWQMSQLSGPYTVLREASVAPMRRVLETYGETINLGVLENDEVVYINILESNRDLRLSAKIGSRHPIHCTSLGKAMLFGLDESEQVALISSSMDARTNSTITNVDDLQKDLKRCLKRGFSVEEEETEEGIVCIGAPILNRQGHPMAALSISAPSVRITKDQYKVIGNALIEAAQEIMKKL